MGSEMTALERLEEVCKAKAYDLIYVKNIKQTPSIIFNKIDKKIIVCSSATESDIDDLISTYMM